MVTTTKKYGSDFQDSIGRCLLSSLQNPKVNMYKDWILMGKSYGPDTVHALRMVLRLKMLNTTYRQKVIKKYPPKRQTFRKDNGL